MAIGSEQVAGMERDAWVGGVRLGQERQHDGEDGGGKGGEHHEDPGPAEPNHDEAADGGGEQRRDADDQEDEREDAGALLGREEIAHHGDGADLRDAAA